MSIVMMEGAAIFMPAWLKRLKAPLLFIGLHSLFSVYRLLPTVDASPAWSFAVPSGELILIFVLLSFNKTGRSSGSSPVKPGINSDILILLITAMIAGITVFYSAGELFYRYFYYDHFHPLSDGRLLPGLFGMLVEKTGINTALIPFLSWTVTAFVLLGAGFLVSLAVKKSIIHSTGKLFLYLRLSAGAAALLIMLLLPVTSPLAQTVIDAKTIVISNRETGTENLSDINEVPSESAGQAAVSTVPRTDEFTLPGIEDADIHVMVVESYGSTLYGRKEYKDALLPLYEELEEVLRSDGWALLSGLVRSPAFGGRSWLADATLLTGEQIEDQNAFENRLLREDPARLLSFVESAGYHRIYAAPGTSKTTDAWLQTYPFEEYLLRYDFNYEGPFLSFGAMSDQYILNRVWRNYLREDRKDFVFYLLVSSHVPFETIPEYKPDWDFSLNGREYESGYLQYFDNDWLSGNELAEGFLAGISYTLTTAVYYLTERLSQNELMLIIGDHQPRRPVSIPGSGYAVPFHLILPDSRIPEMPSSWEISNSFLPPDTPDDENELPEMAVIPHLIERIATEVSKEH